MALKQLLIVPQCDEFHGALITEPANFLSAVEVISSVDRTDKLLL